MVLENRILDIGRLHEWHLEFDNAFGHLAFEFGAGLHQPIVVSLSTLLEAGFEAIRSISHAMSGDGIEQVLVQLEPMGGALVGSADGSPAERLPRFESCL